MGTGDATGFAILGGIVAYLTGRAIRRTVLDRDPYGIALTGDPHDSSSFVGFTHEALSDRSNSFHANPVANGGQRDHGA